MTTYDEDLKDNPFHRELLKSHSDLLERASREKWIICIPRRASVTKPITFSQITEHIIIPDETTKTYNTLNKTPLKITNDSIAINRNKRNEITISKRILFKETFYAKGMKYYIYCLDGFLDDSGGASNFSSVSNLRDCIEFLKYETEGNEILIRINDACEEYLLTHDDLLNFSIQDLENSTQELFAKCFILTLKFNYLEVRIKKDKSLLGNLRVAIEAYMQSCLNNQIFNVISVCFLEQDASVNKAARNLQFSHFDFERCPNFHEAKCELGKINRSDTTLGKFNCIKSAFRVLSKKLTAEDLIEIFAFLIINSQVNNWTANLVYLQRFDFSQADSEKFNERSFLLTTFEAALEYVKSGLLFDSERLNESDSEFVELIRAGDLDSIKELCGSENPFDFNDNEIEDQILSDSDENESNYLRLGDKNDSYKNHGKYLRLGDKNDGDGLKNDSDNKYLRIEYDKNDGDGLKDDKNNFTIGFSSENEYKNLRLSALESGEHTESSPHSHKQSPSNFIDSTYQPGLGTSECIKSNNDKFENDSERLIGNNSYSRLCYKSNSDRLEDVNSQLRIGDKNDIDIFKSAEDVNSHLRLGNASKNDIFKISEDVDSHLRLADCNKSDRLGDDISNGQLSPGGSEFNKTDSDRSKNDSNYLRLDVDDCNQSDRLGDADCDSSNSKSQNLTKFEKQNEYSLECNESLNKSGFVNSQNQSMVNQDLNSKTDIYSSFTKSSRIARKITEKTVYSNSPRNLSKNNSNKTSKAISQPSKTLCHPLCVCENCQKLNQLIYSPDYKDEKGRNGLHIASFYGFPHIVDYFIQKGADVNAMDYLNSAPIHHAATRGHQNALLLLLHSRTDLNLVNGNGNTALHLASLNGHENCVKALLYYSEHVGKKLMIDSQNVNGDSPLHLAVNWGYVSIIKILLQYGASINIRNKKNKRVVDSSNNFRVKKLLLGKSTNQIKLRESKPVERVNNSEQSKKVELLLKAIEDNDLPLSCFYLGIPVPVLQRQKSVSEHHPLCDCVECSFEENNDEDQEIIVERKICHNEDDEISIQRKLSNDQIQEIIFRSNNEDQESTVGNNEDSGIIVQRKLSNDEDQEKLGRSTFDNDDKKLEIVHHYDNKKQEIAVQRKFSDDMKCDYLDKSKENCNKNNQGNNSRFSLVNTEIKNNEKTRHVQEKKTIKNERSCMVKEDNKIILHVKENKIDEDSSERLIVNEDKTALRKKGRTVDKNPKSIEDKITEYSEICFVNENDNEKISHVDKNEIKTINEDTSIVDNERSTLVNKENVEDKKNISKLTRFNNQRVNFIHNETKTKFKHTEIPGLNSARKNPEQKLNVNTTNTNGYSPLHVAAKFGRKEILRLLLDTGSNVNSRTRRTLYTPLHLACINQRLPIVKELLQCGSCEIDSRDFKGNAAVHYACFKNDLKILEVLLVNGCDVGVRNNEGKSVLQEAEDMALSDAVRLIKEKCVVSCVLDDEDGFLLC